LVAVVNVSVQPFVLISALANPKAVQPLKDVLAVSSFTVSPVEDPVKVAVLHLTSAVEVNTASPPCREYV